MIFISAFPCKMSFSLTSKQLCRRIYSGYRCYCEKSIYQKHEEGEKERTVYGHPYPDWRKPWIKRKGEYQSKLNVFVERNPSPDILNAMQKIPEMKWQDVKDWWAKMQEIKVRQNQIYLKERQEALGSNLAAAHFFIYRGASVRYVNSDKWLSGNPILLGLPTKYKDGYFIEAIDCENFKSGIRYEGIHNLTDLNFLKWLSLKNNIFVDEWCLDRLAGQNGGTLEYLDISGCNLNTGGIFALSRMRKLKCLVVTEPKDDEINVGLSILEEENKGLLIKTIDEPKEVEFDKD